MSKKEKEIKKSNIKELPGLNGNAYSASRYLYCNIKDSNQTRKLGVQY